MVVETRSQANMGQSSLLEYRFSNGARPIGSLIELATAVFQRGSLSYAKPETMVPMLSEVLRGKRDASPEIAAAILEFVTEKTQELFPDELEQVTFEFRTRLESGVDEGHNLTARCAKPDVTALIRLVRASPKIVAILPHGAFSDDVGRKVLEEFCRRAALTGSPRMSTDTPAPVELWFRDEIRARKWWWLLHEFLVELDPSKSESSHAQRIIDRSNAGAIIARCVNPMATGAKVVVSNPDNLDLTVGFSLNISRQMTEVSLSSLGPDGAREWVANVYQPISAVEPDVKILAADAFGYRAARD